MLPQSQYIHIRKRFFCQIGRRQQSHSFFLSRLQSQGDMRGALCHAFPKFAAADRGDQIFKPGKRKLPFPVRYAHFFGQ